MGLYKLQMLVGDWINFQAVVMFAVNTNIRKHTLEV